jgi:hypothetical protein
VKKWRECEKVGRCLREGPPEKERKTNEKVAFPWLFQSWLSSPAAFSIPQRCSVLVRGPQTEQSALCDNHRREAAQKRETVGRLWREETAQRERLCD